MYQERITLVEGKAFEKTGGDPEIEEEEEWGVVPVILSSVLTCSTFLLMTWISNILMRSVIA